MSESVELTAQYYTIRSTVVGGKPLAGVGHILPTFQPVRIEADIYIWKITPVPGNPGVFQLSLKDSYPYTGVKDRTVIATVIPEENKEWRIRFWAEERAFTIELNNGIRPPSAWTLSREGPDIQLGFYEVQPEKLQLFKIEPGVE